MFPQIHFLAGLVASIILYFGFPEIGILNLVIFLIITVGVDVDHYFYYVYKKGDWNLFSAFRWFVDKKNMMFRAGDNFRHNVYSGFCFFHGIEVLVIFVALGYYFWSGFYFVSLGILFHLVLDWIDEIIHRSRFDRVSIIWDFFKYRKLVFIDDAIGLK